MYNRGKRTARNTQIANMVFAAILIAIILIMTFVPQFGYITIGVVPVTIIHIPVIIGGIVLGRKYGLLLGLVFGLGAMTRSFMEYTLYAPFTNPLLSVVPRMFIGFIASDINLLFSKLFKNDKLAVPFSLAVVTLIHSLIVLPLLYFVWDTGFYFFNTEFIGGLDVNVFIFIWGSFVANSLLEILLAVLIGAPIVTVLKIVRDNQK